VASHREEIKREILQTFNKNVRGKIPDLRTYNLSHDGAEGDWLTIAMGLNVNGNNEPDFKGFEMKKDSAKTTFGDWSPNLTIYKKVKNGSKPRLTRNEFLQIFGRKSPDPTGRKSGRFSWSGTVFPTVHSFNEYGQIMKVDSSNNIVVLYSYSKDKRTNKNKIVPADLQMDDLVLVKWDSEKLRVKLEKKFNQLGWFKCISDKNGRYQEVQFGYPIQFESFIALVKRGLLICDCGMHSQNKRPYMSWRAQKNIWNSLAEK
jgi:hypothetical protein